MDELEGRRALGSSWYLPEGRTSDRQATDREQALGLLARSLGRGNKFALGSNLWRGKPTP